MRNIGYYLLRAPMLLLGHLPLRVHYAFADALAWLAGSVLHYRERVVITNLSRSYPDMKYGELKKVEKDFYRHFGELVAESVWYGACSPKRLHASRIVEMDNVELLNRLFSSGKGVIIMSSHAGNWELFSGMKSYCYGEHDCAFTEKDVCMVYKRLSSKVWDEVLMANRLTPVEDKAGYDGCLESGEVIRYMISHKNTPKIYMFNTDQFPYKGAARIDVGEFMHQHTYAMGGGAALAHKFGMSVVFLSYQRRERGHYVMHFTTIAEDASAVSVEDMLKEYYKLLQVDLEAQPANYLWTHKRWK